MYSNIKKLETKKFSQNVHEFVESVIIDSIFALSARDDGVNYVYVMRLYLYTDARVDRLKLDQYACVLLERLG